jgi:hypothetical protein
VGKRSIQLDSNLSIGQTLEVSLDMINKIIQTTRLYLYSMVNFRTNKLQIGLVSSNIMLLSILSSSSTSGDKEEQRTSKCLGSNRTELSCMLEQQIIEKYSRRT